MKNLYKLKFEFEVVVLAASEQQAVKYANEQYSEMFTTDNWQGDCVEVVSVIEREKDLPTGWDTRCLPWGEMTDKDIKTILLEKLND